MAAKQAKSQGLYAVKEARGHEKTTQKNIIENKEEKVRITGAESHLKGREMFQPGKAGDANG